MVHQTTCGKDVVGPSASLECVDEEDTPSVSCQLSVCEKGNAKSHGCWCGGVSDGGVGVGWLDGWMDGWVCWEKDAEMDIQVCRRVEVV